MGKNNRITYTDLGPLSYHPRILPSGELESPSTFSQSHEAAAQIQRVFKSVTGVATKTSVYQFVLYKLPLSHWGPVKP